MTGYLVEEEGIVTMKTGIVTAASTQGDGILQVLKDGRDRKSASIMNSLQLQHICICLSIMLFKFCH